MLTPPESQDKRFKKIIPNDYKKMIMIAARLEEQGMKPEEAQLEAFNENFQKGGM